MYKFRLALLHKTLLAVIAAIILLSLTVSNYAGLPMAPYLQAVTDNSIYVLVESDTNDTITVEYGATARYGSKAGTVSIEQTNAKPVTYVHNIKLTGLSPESEYHYKVSMGKKSSPDYTFVTAVKAGTNFRFAWMADTRGEQNDAGVKIHSEISALIREANPRFSMYGGDLCLDTSYNKWKSQYFIPNEMELIARVPFFNTPGNHESWNKGPNTKAFTQAPETSSGVQDYYSFDYGDIHFLVINNEIPYNVGSPQYEFARKDLQNSKSKWKIVTNHKPAYCTGNHGEDEDMKVMSTTLFEKYGVDMVLSGHSHIYQHNLVNGIHYMIMGSAGAPLYDFGNAPYVVKSLKDYSFGIFDVTPDSILLKTYNNKGKELETIKLAK